MISYEELVLKCKQREAYHVVNQPTHAEIVYQGYRYFCGWAAEKKDGSQQALGWIVYSREKEA